MTLNELHDWYRKYVGAGEDVKRSMAEGHVPMIDDTFKGWTNEELGALAFEVLSLLLIHRDDPVQTLQVMQAIKVLAQHKAVDEYLLNLMKKGTN